MSGQPEAPAPERHRETRTELDRQVEEAQGALLKRFAPDTVVRRLDWSHGQTQVLELGAGPPLLLVHGGGDGAFVWVPILAALARRHRVLAVDRPGHGLADPFDYRGVDVLEHASIFLRDVVDALALSIVDIVGNGLGGLLSVAFALNAPNRVSRLVLAGAPAGVTREVPLPLRMLGLPLIGPRVGRLVMSNPTREESRKFWGKILVVHPENLDDTLLEADVVHTRRNVGSILSLIRNTVGLRGLQRHLVLGDRWRQLKVPTLVLHGDRDAFVTRSMRVAWDAIAGRNPGFRVISIPRAGNHLWLDAPERFPDELERLLGAAES
jgi:pimeloyl-ACP methyl ester carboxylesterase